jgi:hypothetical protein
LGITRLLITVADELASEAAYAETGNATSLSTN